MSFISEIDKAFAKFDANHPKSASQLAEINKYQRIKQLRDDTTQAHQLLADNNNDVWEDF
jgi:uncharacterized protein YfbU (UPF0304 family)